MYVFIRNITAAPRIVRKNIPEKKVLLFPKNIFAYGIIWESHYIREDLECIIAICIICQIDISFSQKVFRVYYLLKNKTQGLIFIIYSISTYIILYF